MPRKTRSKKQTVEEELILEPEPVPEPVVESEVEVAEANTGKQLVIPVTQPDTASGNKPIVLLQCATEEQFERALQLFQPPEPTKSSLIQDPEFVKNLAEVTGHIEGMAFTDKSGKLFPNPMISNYFENAMMDKTGEQFRVNEWFSDTRGELPEAIQKWDPNGFNPMPEYEGPSVDWYDELTTRELEYPGFVQMLKNCIDLEYTTTNVVMKQRSTAGLVAAMGNSGTKMPKPGPNPAKAVQNQFTPSNLVSNIGPSPSTASPFSGRDAGMLGNTMNRGGSSSRSPWGAATF